MGRLRSNFAGCLLYVLYKLLAYRPWYTRTAYNKQRGALLKAVAYISELFLQHCFNHDILYALFSFDAIVDSLICLYVPFIYSILKND
jgi:hypothetical protein